MERIKLTKREKHVLIELKENRWRNLGELDSAAILSLRSKGLVGGTFSEQDKPIWTSLTEYGKEYLYENPKLRNPFSWIIFTAICTAIMAVAAILALIIACARL